MTRSEQKPLPVLLGCTASGKTELALRVLERLGGEVLSLDSMLVYRRLDIGTAKPGREERERVRHHLIDLVGADERYDVQRYLVDFAAAEQELTRRGVPALVVGGTGFYLQSLLHGMFEGPPVDAELRARLVARAAEVGSRALHVELARVDPRSAERIHPNDEKRVVRGLEVHAQTGRPLSSWQEEWGWGEGERPSPRPSRIVGLEPPAERLEQRIRRRTRSMLGAGWVEEALSVRENEGFGPTAIQALGYREVLAFADGELTRPETEATIALRTRQFARRQRTWFKRFPDVRWVDPEEPAAEQALEAALSGA